MPDAGAITAATPAAPAAPAAAPPAVPVAPAAAAPAAAPAPAAPAASDLSPWAATPAKPEGEPKAEGAAPAAAPPKPETKEIVYEFKAPEGKVVDQAIAEQVKSFAKELRLSPEQAQKVYDRDAAFSQGFEQNARVEMKARNAQWYQDLKASKEFGGEKFAENADLVKKAFEYGDPDGKLRSLLRAAEYENLPELVHFVHRFGKLFADDKLHIGAPAVGTVKDTRSAVDKVAGAIREGFKKGARP